MCAKCLIKMEKAFNLWLEEMNRRHIPGDGSVWPQRASSLDEVFSKGSLKTSDTSHLPQVRDDYNHSILRERDHTHIIFGSVYSYSCSILLVIVISL